MKNKKGKSRVGSSHLLAQYESILLQTMKALAMPGDLSCINDLPEIAGSIFKDYVEATRLKVTYEPPLTNMVVRC